MVHIKKLSLADHYVKGGSTVNLCALDIAKAFDRVDHCITTTNGSAPYQIILLLKCCVCVFSFWFGILAGVTQGGMFVSYFVSHLYRCINYPS